MLQLTSLAGFGAQAQAADVTPNLVSIADIASAGFVASALTSAIAITGISVPVTLRLVLTSAMSVTRTLTIYRDSIPQVLSDSGTFADVTAASGQTLQFEFANAADLTTWSGIATLTNLSDGGAVLASFAFSLQDTGSGPGGGGGGGGGGGALP